MRLPPFRRRHTEQMILETARDTTRGSTLSSAALLAAADAAVSRDDHDEALRLWSELRGRFPQVVAAWLRPAECMIRLRRLPEAETLLAEAKSRFPNDFWLARTYASIFRNLGDAVEAYTEARALRQSFADNPMSHADLVQLLLGQKGVAAAEAEARACLARFPDARWLLHMYARCADQSGDNHAAAERWTELLVRHPDHEQAYGPAVRTLIAENRLDEAAGIARSGLRLLPGSAAVREACEVVDAAHSAPMVSPPERTSAMELLVEALRAVSAGAWDDAVRRWDALRAQAPTFAPAYAGAARALRMLGRMAEAEIVLAKARRDLPADAGVLWAWAEGAIERDDAANALLRCRALQKAFPAAAGVDLAIARALRALGRLDEADIAFVSLAGHHPTELASAEEFASVASDRGDRPEAIRRWRQVTAVFPCQAAGYWHLADALVRAEQMADADAVLCDAATRFPDDLETGLRWAMSGRASGDAARFDALCRRFPELAPLLS